ncbi:hypothetical protein MCOR02_003520 [Pyricularia oryzae]|uniref:Uncharacterized protein n=1 Tax=Pyricularia grisea TaxID=148305 RepID=A0ABQ8NLJ5_PYRGI|nr:hypothetical protein MCOR01_011640 [Pyricularia oryzae]KAI6298875.1 hypothetical protein MCOR33_005064 [Pyricularia grisea]KAH9439987.1 hypothetical protein MCOR02_003520 [Pyricularia oryzae]KAI6335720.1 hypothetical protein MCOR30_003771 [Pyricularia oryzae]KAI6400643.1 hypothetical protein MCOR23_004703 [Pyricularia oryzae]
MFSLEQKRFIIFRFCRFRSIIRVAALGSNYPPAHEGILAVVRGAQSCMHALFKAPPCDAMDAGSKPVSLFGKAPGLAF